MSVNCNGCSNGSNLVNLMGLREVSEAGKKVTVAITGDAPIEIDDNTTSTAEEDNYSFNVRYNPYTAITITSFTFTPSGIKAKGTVVNSLTLNWAFNKAINNQALTRNGISAGSLTAVEREMALVDLAIAHDTSLALRTFVLFGSDTVEDDTKELVVEFGNYLYRFAASLQTSAQDYFDLINANVGITKLLRKDRLIEFTALGGVSVHDVLVIPSAYNLLLGTQFIDRVTNLTGGYTKIYSNVAFENEHGYTENFDIWISTFDNIVGALMKIV